MPELVEWIPAEDACARLGKSSKTLERLAASGEIESKMQSVPGRKSRRVFFAPAVERIAHDWDERKRSRVADGAVSRQAAAETESPAYKTLIQVLDRLTSAQQPRALAGESLGNLPQKPLTTVELNQAPVELWLTEKQAKEYSGLSRRDLRSLVDDGTLTTRRYGRELRYQRHSLEVFSRS